MPCPALCHALFLCSLSCLAAQGASRGVVWPCPFHYLALPCPTMPFALPFALPFAPALLPKDYSGVMSGPANSTTAEHTEQQEHGCRCCQIFRISSPCNDSLILQTQCPPPKLIHTFGVTVSQIQLEPLCSSSQMFRNSRNPCNLGLQLRLTLNPMSATHALPVYECNAHKVHPSVSAQRCKSAKICGVHVGAV